MKLLTVLIVIAAFFASSSFAESFPEKSGYLIDTRGDVVKNSYGECWRTGYWTPELAIEECDPDLTQKPEVKAVAAIPVIPVINVIPVAIVRLSTETLFDFDKSDVKPQGRKVLDEQIVSGMMQHPGTVRLIITGHADRIGTEQYNQALSERRANAVKTYLQQQGIPAQRISASGKGESMPDPVANTRVVCKGLSGEKLIACLQPDRRVIVESADQ